MNNPCLFPHLSVFRKEMKIVLVTAAVCILLLFSFFLAPADAHKVNIFAYAQDGRVYAEGYFVDGSKCKNSVIEVLDGKTGVKLLEGKTDDNGQVSFGIPHVTSLKLILRAGEGHQNEYFMSEEEVRKAMPAAKKQAEKKGEKQAERGKKDASEKEQPKDNLPADAQKVVRTEVPSEDLEAAVGKVVDSKLQPVLKILLELQERTGKPGLTEILGGIGYIIGILGIIAYFKGRGSNRKS
jgi:nickel transport protein